MQTLRSSAGAAATAAAVLVIGVCGCSRKPISATVTRRDIVGYEVLKGELATPPSARADILPAYRAPVDKVFASVGGRVRKGEVLVQLSFPSVEAAYEQARQYVKSAEAAYAAAGAQYNGPVQEARGQLEIARSAERAAAESGVDLAQATAARVDAEHALAQAQADKQNAVAVFKEQLGAARRQLQEAKAGAKLASVRTPISGTVLALNARPGVEVGTDRETPIATVVDLGAIQVHADMTPAQAGLIGPGADALVAFNEVANRQFEGAVARVTSMPVADGAGTAREMHYVAIIEFKNDEGLVKPAMTLAGAYVKVGEARNVLAFPNDALETDSSGKTVVNVLRGGEWQSVAVEVGLRGVDYTQIKSGLTEGDTVQVRPK